MDLSKLSANKLRTELWTCHILSEQRCLRKACEWAEDLLLALPQEGEEKLLTKLEKDLNSDTNNELNPQFEHAKTCFWIHEYDRAAHLIRQHNFNDKSRFLHYFAIYKSAEKKRIDLMNDVTVNIPRKAILKFNELRDSLERSMDQHEPDGWLLYVYGLVLFKFKLHAEAISVLVKAINLTPINWSAWYILTQLIDNRDQLNSLALPNHLFKVFFYHMMRLELDMDAQDPWTMVGAHQTRSFLEKHFKNSLFIKTLKAKSLGYQASRYKEAMEVFAEIRQEDPYRVDAMEIYSNLLYVRRQRKELAKLAYDVERVDPFTSEANSCIANSFSAREQHNKAIVYFTRAIRLHPDHLNSWTLIGHEYLETKSIDKALQAYRFAISINKRDCRAWLGLGNTFETIMSNPNVNNPNYEPCIYYYSQVGKYRPKDHIMFMAMSSIYEKMGDYTQAAFCAERAGPEALLKLAKLYEIIKMRTKAAETYQRWLDHLDAHSHQTGENSRDLQHVSQVSILQSSTVSGDHDADVSYARRFISEVYDEVSEAT